MNNASHNCYWITGLSASGKTTISSMLVKHLKEKNLPVIHLDGDDLRNVFDDNGNTKDERLTRAKKFAKLCKLISNQEINVVIGIIGLFTELHEWNRRNIKNYIEIFLDIPLSELERRDPKNIYKKAKQGKVSDVAGIDLKVEFPLNPDILIKWKNKELPEETFTKLLDKLENI